MRLFVNSRPANVINHIGRDAYLKHYGFLTIPSNGVAPFEAISLGVGWAIDNFAFSGFNAQQFKRLLDRYQHLEGCLFVVIPDVVANAQATLRRWERWAGYARLLGYPLALAAQDGLENLPIPWNEFTALFIGGSTEWKLGQACREIVTEAKTRGKYIHMGRVNSRCRIRYAQSIGCDSVDGSSFCSHLHKNKSHLPYLETQQMNFY